MDSLLYYSNSFNPYLNIATEQVLMKTFADNAVIFLWRNQDCVVFGRNQNVYNECNIENLRSLNVLPVRRTTGGGAVFHDINNLNFSFISPKKNFEKQKSMGIIKNALLSLNIPAEISGRNDVLVDGAKVSGNAYYSTDKNTLHHGTLLIDTDIEKMEKVLSVDKMKLKAHGVRSVKSRVLNLKEKYDYSIKDYENALKEAFKGYYCERGSFSLLEKKDINLEEINDLAKLYKSEDWIFAGSKNFKGFKRGEFEKKTKFPWGALTVVYFDFDGVKRVKIYSDTLYVDSFLVVKEQIENSDFDEIEKLKVSADASKECQEIYRDVVRFILS